MVCLMAVCSWTLLSRPAVCAAPFSPRPSWVPARQSFGAPPFSFFCACVCVCAASSVVLRQHFNTRKQAELLASWRAEEAALFPLPAAGTSWKSGTDLGMPSEMRTRTGGQMCCAGWTEQALRWAGLSIEPAARLRRSQISPGCAGRGQMALQGGFSRGSGLGKSAGAGSRCSGSLMIMRLARQKLGDGSLLLTQMATLARHARLPVSGECRRMPRSLDGGCLKSSWHMLGGGWTAWVAGLHC